MPLVVRASFGVRRDFTLVESTTPGVWHYQFQIGNATKSGRIEARLDLLAIRRMHERIDRELRKTIDQ